jgi:hypothetical protein
MEAWRDRLQVGPSCSSFGPFNALGKPIAVSDVRVPAAMAAVLGTSSFCGDAAALRRSGSHAACSRVAVVTTAKESRIGKVPITLPKGVTVTLKENHMTVKVRSRAVT